VAGIERDSLLGIYRALFGRNVPLDFVHIDHLSSEKLRQYRIVVFPYPLMMPQAAAAPLREYVSAGGTLVAEARLAWNNERGSAADRIPGLGLWEVMGARETAIQTGVDGRTELRWTGASIPGIRPGDRLRARWYEETLEPIGPQSHVVAQFADGSAAAVQSQYGRGKTLLLGSYVSAGYESTRTPDVERFYAALLKWADVTMPVEVTGAPLEVRYLESGDDILMFVFNHEPARATGTVSLRVGDAAYAATNLVTGVAVPTTSGPGVMRMDVSLDPQDVGVFKLAKAAAR
jgi:beta-galactosidase